MVATLAKKPQEQRLPSAIQQLFQLGPTARWRFEMKKPVAKVLLGTSAALATLIAAQYLSHEAAYAQRRHAAPEAYDTRANPNYGFGPRVRVRPDAVVSGDRLIGGDPDPFIRGEILRNYHSGRQR
jgi:hypothetical protein